MLAYPLRGLFMTATPVPALAPPRRRTLLGFLLALSLIFNFVILAAVGLLLIIAVALNSRAEGPDETFYAGERSATDKIAIVRIDGVILEGFTEFAMRQLHRAARDEHVKAVVLRINTPGGSITA